MSVDNIINLMSLEKRYLELHYLSLHYISIGSDKAKEVLEEKNRVEGEIERINNKLSSIILFYPFQETIENYTEKIKNYKEEDIVNALRTKQGELFSLIKNRGILIKQNFERQREIAELIMFVNSIPNKQEIAEQVKKGSIEIEVEEGKRDKLLLLLNRAGIACKYDSDKNKIISGSSDWNERKIEIDGKYYWLDNENAKKIEELLRELNEIGMKIQLKNAERQIKTFSEEEEKEFQEIQKKYLSLIQQKKEELKRLNQ